jgi:hypothetical protein
MIKVPSITDAFTYMAQVDSSGGIIGVPPFNSGYYFLFVGCQANVVLGQFKISYQYDFDPALAAIPYVARELPKPGIMSIPAVINMIRSDKSV